MKKQQWMILAALIVVILAYLGLSNRDEGQKVDVYQTISQLKGFNKKDVEGEYFILHFWAKWCEPCADEIPTLVEFAKKAQFGKPLKILAVSLDESLEISKQILPDHGTNLPANFLLVLDTDHQVAEKMGSYQYPESYFIDPKGKILEKWIGPQKWMKPEVFEFFKSKLI